MRPPQSIRVLVVEDEVLVGEMIQAVLEQLGYVVVGRAADGAEAIEQTCSLKPDVVLMDIGLPDMDGIAAAERISAVLPTPVVILSAYDTPALLERATSAGVGAYLVKPADAREIERGIAVARARFDDMVALRDLNRELQAEIAERKRVEEALRASEEMFRTAVDFSYDWEYWLGPDGRYVYVSPACERITGYSRAEFHARPDLLVEITIPEDREALSAHLDHLDAEGPCDLHFRIHTRSGDVRWIDHVCQAVYRSDGSFRGRRASNRDSTERRRLEADLREARKMEAIAQLAGGLAHDLNNLLTVVNGYAELAFEAAAHHPQLQEDLGEIREAGERAADIVNRLLAFGRQQLLQVRTVHLNRFLAELRPDLDGLLGRGVRLNLRPEAVSSEVVADPEKLRQVILELSRNARDAMPEGGTLVLQTSDARVEGGSAESRPGLEVGEYVRLTVRDTGAGMPADTVERIFEPFFTTKGLANSDGLGLAAAYGLVRQIGGNIVVSSEPNVGTTFDIYLPRAAAEAGAGASTPQSAEGEGRQTT